MSYLYIGLIMISFAGALIIFVGRIMIYFIMQVWKLMYGSI